MCVLRTFRDMNVNATTKEAMLPALNCQIWLPEGGEIQLRQQWFTGECGLRQVTIPGLETAGKMADLLF